MKASVVSHPWSMESLFAKVMLYGQRMEEEEPNDWRFGFWSALSLELLCRAALANVSPVLLADAKTDWHNLLHALGHVTTAKKFTPSSLRTREIVARLSELLPEFTKELAGFCSQHIERRNAELHSGELAFAGLGTAAWLPSYYAACDVLLASIGKSLSDFISDPAAAIVMIDSREDAAANAVQQDIAAYARVWADKLEEERQNAAAQAIAWATRQTGHRVKCPACGSHALVKGEPSGPVATKIDDGDVVQKQRVVPSSFECVACGLRISGLSKLTAAGLGDAFTETSMYPAADFFGLYTEGDLEQARREMPVYDDDFNEY